MRILGCLTTLLILLVAGACAKSYREEILVGSWEYEAFGGKIKMHFNKDGTALIPQPDSSSKQLRWKLDGDKLVLFENGASDSLKFEIVQLTDSVFSYRVNMNGEEKLWTWTKIK